MKRSYLPAILLFLLTAAQAFAQQNAIDSLQRLLAKATTDTAKIDLMVKIASSYWYTQPKQSAEYANRAVSLARKIGNVKREADALNALAGSYWVQGNLANAFDYWNQMLEITTRIGYTRRSMSGLLNIALIYWGIEDFHNAFAYSWKARAIANKLNSMNNLIGSSLNIAEMHLQNGQYDSAAYCLLSGRSQKIG